ncbi:Rqc2 family fibronectin-binding protein [Caldanaerobius polysaccharolyticus]|uniref:Rqc2 family fibronectin-binding protein n=1 Tax=Caldanaerobius polysaccharolyticus TaxID=44256 RepID=UPI00047DAD5C|nr:NFACT RNA binding domain-containing protein [Caldanaerobius polysaccharolyticus]
MALDGITLYCLKSELNELIGGKIEKIYQPESETIWISVRNNKKNYKLVISSNASSARIHLTGQEFENPVTPPPFCMSLRKHLLAGIIHGIRQEGFDRILYIDVKTKTELEDPIVLTLTVEIMGKHSNIILCDQDMTIISCIKNVTQDMSRRVILPGVKYQLPPTPEKVPPDSVELNQLEELIKRCKDVSTFFTDNIQGISPLVSREILFRAGIENIGTADLKLLYSVFKGIIEGVKANRYNPCLAIDSKTGMYKDFSCIDLTHLAGKCELKNFDSVNSLLDEYYTVFTKQSRLKQLSSDLKKIIDTNLDRCYKKLKIQQEDLAEAEDREKYRLYGELITANLYNLKKGQQCADLYNYYDGNTISIPMDPSLTPAENAQRYYKRYNKLKSAYNMLLDQIEENKKEIDYLESQLTNIQQAENESDLLDIKAELIREGYIKNNTGKKEMTYRSKPRHYRHNGFDIYVGKNNMQNDYLTLRFARTEDLWLHTSKVHGSHVIIKAYGKEVPPETLEAAARLAAYYSKARESSKVPVDYTLRKYVKKPNGAKPGMVIYENYKTILVNPEIEDLEET